MELNDALRRIVGQHWRLLTACLLFGLTLGLLFAPHGKEYSASARLVLDTPDPVARQQSQAIADTAKAIATSPSKVSRALRKAGVDRGDPTAFAKQHVSVAALGSSGVIQLSVSDRDPRVAASVANALVSLLIRTRLEVTNGQTDEVFADLDQRTAELSRKITTADENVNVLSLQIAAASPSEASVLRTKRDAAQRERDFLAQQRSVLESERASLLSTIAERPRPSIISAATAPAQPEPSQRIAYLVLGALLGLILGMGAAGLIESVRPTLVGSDTLADELDAALLGTLTSPASTAAAVGIGGRLRLAAEAAHVGNVALLATSPDIDLDRLAASLSSTTAVGGMQSSEGASGHLGALRIGRYKPESPPVNNGRLSGLVLVAPTALKKAELSDIDNLLKVSRLPLLGLITYTPRAAGPFRRVKGRLEHFKTAVAE